MVQNQPFEIPEQLRELAERNVEQARAAYGQFMDAMVQAMGMWMADRDTCTDTRQKNLINVSMHCFCPLRTIKSRIGQRASRFKASAVGNVCSFDVMGSQDVEYRFAGG
jgi:hypothetical protein